MTKSNILSFVLGLALSAAVLLTVLPIHKYESNWDGRSLKVILFAHNAAYGLLLQDSGDTTLPADHVQFLENFNIELYESGNLFTVRYSPRDKRIRGGAYKVVVLNNDGELTLEKVEIEP